jgi:hypothetical protein
MENVAGLNIAGLEVLFDLFLDVLLGRERPAGAGFMQSLRKAGGNSRLTRLPGNGAIGDNSRPEKWFDWSAAA